MTASRDALALRCGVASVWFLTGVLVLHPAYRAVGETALARLGLPAALMWLACAGEVVLSAVVLRVAASRALAGAQVAAVTFFTLVLAVSQPLLLASPYGVLTKNLPFVACVLTAHLLATGGWTPRASWFLRVGMALPWLTEGLVPKLLVQQPEELAIVVRSGVDCGRPELALGAIGVLQLTSGVLALVLPSGRWLRGLWGAQALALVALPLWVGFLEPWLWVHPFGPLTKNVPLVVGTALLWARARTAD